MGVLTSTWDAQRYNAGRNFQGLAFDASNEGVRYLTMAGQEHDQGAGTFNSELLRETLRERFFLCYMHMVIKLDKAPEKLASWCEGCSCHYSLFHGKEYPERAKLMRIHFGGATTVCPMAGKRAPELATGSAVEFMTEHTSTTFVDVAAKHGPLSNGDLARLDADFRLAFAYVQHEIAMAAVRISAQRLNKSRAVCQQSVGIICKNE